MALLDEQGVVRAANPAFRALVCLPLGRDLPAARLFRSPARFADWLAGGGLMPLEEMLEGGEEPRPVSCRLRSLPGGQRLLLLQDLTEHRRFRKQAEEGERLRALGQLAGGVAHDFNNILAIIVSSAESLRSDVPAGGAERDTALEALLAAADRGAALVRRLLALAGRQPLLPRAIVLDEAVTGLEPLLRSMAGRHVSLHWRLEAPGRAIMADPVQLDQMVLNLASNAVQAMARQPGNAGGTAGASLTIATGTRLALQAEPGIPDLLPPGRWVMLSVSDNGPGIPPGVLGRIFEPFFTTRSAEGGTGLGLATVHGIVRQFGGVLQVVSRPGEGASFRIYLPRHQESALPPPRIGDAGGLPVPTPVPTLAREQHGGLAGQRVLLVEDEAPLRRLAEQALRREGMEVRAATDGEEALDLLAGGFRPDILVSDVAMPGMDGVSLLREMRRRLPALPAVLVSGYSERLMEREALEEGGRNADITGFLAKPYRPAALVETLRQRLVRVVEESG
ncbi:response regulator [Roseomonas gilardii subsp. gilardii]|uniref:ATP-binding protein n=1 Tax=Roseomonas gilardii TaxID=257708 RepID=UPI001FF78702|nr:ATP-binding protein [Roseomonas gilardii]UPG72653.1 response regulator [Roseomonas gilardii subsp. gilardii]